MISYRLPRRKQSGSSIAEFGPALGILLFSMFFPMLDMVMLGFCYTQCMALNSLQTQKAAELGKAAAQDPGGPVKAALPKAWEHTGMGSFVNLVEDPATNISYETAVGTDQYVVVSTTFSIRPFLTIPIIPGVPGLSAPASFTITTRRVVEDPRA